MNISYLEFIIYIWIFINIQRGKGKEVEAAAPSTCFIEKSSCTMSSLKEASESSESRSQSDGTTEWNDVSLDLTLGY